MRGSEEETRFRDASTTKSKQLSQHQWQHNRINSFRTKIYSWQAELHLFSCCQGSDTGFRKDRSIPTFRDVLYLFQRACLQLTFHLSIIVWYIGDILRNDHRSRDSRLTSSLLQSCLIQFRSPTKLLLISDGIPHILFTDLRLWFCSILVKDRYHLVHLGADRKTRISYSSQTVWYTQNHFNVGAGPYRRLLPLVMLIYDCNSVTMHATPP